MTVERAGFRQGGRHFDCPRRGSARRSRPNEGAAMKVREAMTPDVRLVAPEQTIREAARLMAECDIGALPVGAGDRLIGVITDRDIAVRAVAEGHGPDTRIDEVMSHEVKYCYDDEDLGAVADNMGQVQLRRLPVVNRDKRLVGIVSLGDVAACEAPARTGQAVAGISAPGGAHSQAAH
jgi:CBS domain-containing protein